MRRDLCAHRLAAAVAAAGGDDADADAEDGAGQWSVTEGSSSPSRSC